MENKIGFFRAVVIAFTVIFMSQRVKITDASCSLPPEIVGAWEDSTKGMLTFNDSTIFGYEFASFGTLTLTCWQQNDTVYIFESSEFEFFSLNFTAYFCWNFTQVTSDMFYYYEYGDPLAGANNERVRVYLPSFARVYNDICANLDVGLGTYRVLFRNNTLSSAISNCPKELQNYYNYSVVGPSGGNTCTASKNQLDVCSNSSAFTFNGSECTTHLAYSDTGAVNCLFAIQDTGNQILYMTLYNDGTVDNSLTHRTTCMIVSYATPSSLVGAQYPNQCPNDMTETFVTSPGAYVYFIKTGGCSEDSFPWWIIILVVGLLLALIIFIACCYKKKLDEEEKKKRLLAEEEEDGRYDPNNLLSRGDRPPYASITIMGGRRIGKDGRYLDDDEDYEPPKIKRPKSEGKHRRFDKRKRQWVIDKDGNVKKVWKEERESPDSGVEVVNDFLSDFWEDQVDGEGSNPRKSARFKDPLQGDDLDFAKKHGRKELKSAKEIEEKGDREMNSSKLKKKMKGMLSARKSARFRKSARSGKKSVASKAYTADGHDSDRSWGSSDGDYEEVTLDSDRTEMLENKANEEKEKQDEAKSGKETGEKKKGDTVTAEAVASLAVVSEINEKDKQGKKLKSAMKKKGKDAGEKDVETGKKEGDKAGEESVKEKTKDEGEGKVERDSKQGKESVAVTGAVVVAKEVKDPKGKGKGKGKKTKEAQKTQSEKTEEKKDVDTKAIPGKAVAVVTGKEEEKDKKGGEKDTKEEEKDKKKEGTKKEGVKEKKEEGVKKDQVKEKKEEGVKKDEAKEKISEKVAEEPTIDTKDKSPVVTEPPISKIDQKKLEKEKKAEQKKKEKEEKQRLREEQQREKEAKKKEKQEQKRKEKEEKETIGDRYITAQIALETEKEAKKAEEEKKEKSDTDAQVESEEGGKQELDKEGKTSSPRPPSQDTRVSNVSTDTPSSDKPPSGSMRPRREQSIVLDLDRTKSDLGMEDPDKRPSTTGERTLGAVTELVETARSQAEGRGGEREEDVAREERGGRDEGLPVSARATVQHPGLKPEPKKKGKEQSVQKKKTGTDQSGSDQKTDGEKIGKVAPGKLAAETTDVKDESKLKGKATGSDKEANKKTGRGADDKATPRSIMKQKKDGRAEDTKDTLEKPALVRKISVSEADSSSKTDDSYHEKDSPKTQDSDDSESSEEEIVPIKKKPRAQGFTFPDENMAMNTFKKTGEVINAKPVKTKKRRTNRVTVENLPDRTNQAFGIAKKPLPKSKTNADKGGSDAKGKDAKLSSASGSDATEKDKAKVLAPVRGPMTIKDISKKPAEPQGDTPRGRSQLRKVRTTDQQDSSASPAGPLKRAESLSPAARRAGAGQGEPDRRVSEVDKKHQLQLMTRLMSLAEQTEGEETPTPRASTAGRKSARNRQNQSSRLGELVGPRPDIKIEGLDQVDGSTGSTPDELKTARDGGVIPGRPPTQHSYARPSREHTMHMEPISQNFSRSSSERRHTTTVSSASMRGGNSQRTPDSEEQRFVKFKQGVLQQLEQLGQDEMNAILYPRIQRYPHDGPNRSEPAYKSMNALQRIHRKKNRQVAPIPMELPPIKGAYGKVIDDYDDIEDPRMRGLLEELYKDKKYLDKTLERNTDDGAFIQSRAKEGRTYLLDRARFWSTQQPIVRPGTTNVSSRASTALPSSRVPTGIHHNREQRSKSNERTPEFKFNEKH